jgi:hypothetical protein
MASDFTPVRLPPITVWRVLALHVPLVGLGIVLLGAGMREMVLPAGEATRPLITSSSLPAEPGIPTGGGTHAPHRVGRPAILSSPRLTATCPDPSEVTATDARPPDSIDGFAAAMFGPPDRQPQETLAERMLDRGRGQARGYLEQTASARWTAPWYRAALCKVGDER